MLLEEWCLSSLQKRCSMGCNKWSHLDLSHRFLTMKSDQEKPQSDLIAQPPRNTFGCLFIHWLLFIGENVPLGLSRTDWTVPLSGTASHARMPEYSSRYSDLHSGLVSSCKLWNSVPQDTIQKGAWWHWWDPHDTDPGNDWPGSWCVVAACLRRPWQNPQCCWNVTAPNGSAQFKKPGGIWLSL